LDSKISACGHFHAKREADLERLADVVDEYIDVDRIGNYVNIIK